jgi:probable HAF family extracellular repeat protein
LESQDFLMILEPEGQRISMQVSSKILIPTVGFLLIFPGIVSASSVFDVINLGNFSGNSATPTAISSSGSQVVGYGMLNGDIYAASVSGGVLTSMGFQGQANAVNSNGQIVGTTASNQAFIYQNSSMLTLNYQAGFSSWGMAINNSGMIVGAGTTAGGQTVATYWQGGTAHQIGLLGGSFSSAYGVNNSGEVAGTSTVPNGAMAAFTWTSGSTMHNLGTLGGVNSWGDAINNSGLVAGTSQTAQGYTHAFLWNGSTMVDLGTLGGANSYATGINDAGEVVGYSLTSSGQWHAFVYEGGAMYDLNSLLPVGSGWSISMAYGIDAAGDIIGEGTNNGTQYALELVDPPSPSPLGLSAAPEPLSALLTGLGLLGTGILLCIGRRSQLRTRRQSLK